MATDLEPFRQSVVRILGPDGRFFGLGLKAGDGLVMTCAHVVAAALRTDPCALAAPEGSVQVQSPVAGLDGALVGARIVAGGWWPKARAGQRPADICLLALDPATPSAALVSITPALSLTGISCMLLGAPSAHREDLVPITGQVGERKASGRYLLKQDSGYQIEPGCSGAPVCDKATGQVVGMVVQDEKDEALRIAFLIPAEDLMLALNACRAHARSVATRSLGSVRRWVERGVTRLDPGLGRSFKEYVDAYAGEPAAPLPFVGRDDALASVRRNIAGGGVTCIIGGAGSGKSAFLLHLARAIIDDGDEVLLFLPVSIRFSIADEVRGLRMLYLQLGNLFAQLRFSDESSLDTDDYRDRIERGWEFIANQAPRRFVLLVDATDEANGAWIETGVLPYELPHNLSLVVSTRTTPLQGAPDWLQRQRRSDGSLAPSHVMALPALSLESLRVAVEQLGDPYGTFLSDDAAMLELYRLTDHGDPLLVSLWVVQLRQYQGRAQPPGLRQLRSLAPGIDGFLKLWFDQQEQLWKKQKRVLSREQFEPLLYLFSRAAGPISPRDIAELAEILHLSDFTQARDVQLLLDGASRLLVRSGDDGALAFVHPRLGYHYRELLEQQPARAQSIGNAFLNWCRRKIAALEAAQEGPADCPVYLLNHYTQHVKDAGLDVARAG